MDHLAYTRYLERRLALERKRSSVTTSAVLIVSIACVTLLAALVIVLASAV